MMPFTSLEAFRAEQRMAFSAWNPRSFVQITGLTDGIGGREASRTLRPLWTRHMLGVIEAERDRRVQLHR